MTDPKCQYQPSRLSMRHALVICATTLMIVLVGRLLLLLTFGGSVPFWDQWGGENALFGPALNGTLGLSELLAAHNEHRILWTRLTTIGLFLLNGKQWDNTVEAAFSVLLYGIAAAIPLWVATRTLSKRGLALFASVLLMGALLPYAWENIVVGFQSQFFYCTLFSMMAMYVAACREPSPATPLLSLVLISAATLSMAAGVLAALSVAAIFLTRAILQRQRSLWVGFILSVLAGAAGKALTPSPPHHVILRAPDVATFVDSLATSFSWPLPWYLMLIMLLPVAPWLFRAYVRTEFRRADFFFLGVLCLGILNMLAVAYSRGGDLKEVPSRYLDGLFLVVLASGYFSTSMLEASHRSVRVAMGYMPLALAGIGLLYQGLYQIHFLRERAYFTRMETANLARFLGGDAKALSGKPHAHVPYPDPEALATSLEKTDQRPILPASILGLTRAPHTQHGCSISSSTIAGPYVFRCPAALGAQSLPSAGHISTWMMRARQSLAWSAFSMPRITRTPLAVGDSKCAIDSVDEKSTAGHPIALTTDTPTRIQGWGRYSLGAGWLRPQSLRVALRGQGVSYEFDGGMRRFERPDVVAALGNPRYLWSGFDAFLDIRPLPPGEYEILVATGSSPYCESGHRLKLSPAGIPLVQH